MNISTVADILIAIAVLCWITYRQFTWQLASPSRLWRMPAILAVVGLVMLAQTKSLANVQPVDLLILVGELVLALGLGAIMGSLARFRTRAQRASDVSRRSDARADFDPSTTVTETRTGALGAALWIVLILVRVGIELLTAHYFPSALLASTGTILLVIAANRAARALVVTLKLERSGVIAA
jgi:tellurite resistance protein TehA-like permease